MSKKSLLLIALLPTAPLRSFAGDSDDPVFVFDFRPTITAIETAPSATFVRDVELILRTVSNPSTEGAAAWSFSVTGTGLTVEEVTWERTVSASVDDDPPGLFRDGFRTMEIGDTGIDECEGLVGAVGAVVLSFTENVTLEPLGEVSIARITVSGQAPDEAGEEAPASLFYANGCGGSG